MTDKSEEEIELYIEDFDSPLGLIYVGATAKGIYFLDFKRERVERAINEFLYGRRVNIKCDQNEHIKLLKKELEEYFLGTRKKFSVSLDFLGTAFQKNVWKNLLTIPFGKTISYKELSIKMDNLLAIRAIASANGSNKLMILVPCHRIIGSSGDLTGYAGGLERKQWLLDHEKKQMGFPIQAKLDL